MNRDGSDNLAWREASLAIAGTSKSANVGTSWNVKDGSFMGVGCLLCCWGCCFAASSFNCRSLVAGGMRMTKIPGLSPDVSKAMPLSGRGDDSSTLCSAAIICSAIAEESGGA
jgi:hypothetical protein